MTAVEAAAMWVDVNVSFSSARTIVRHLTCKFRHSVQVPFSQIHILGDISQQIEPTFDEFIFKKKEDTKVGEKIKYWHYDIVNLLQLDFERVIKEESTKLHMAMNLVYLAIEKECLLYSVLTMVQVKVGT